MAEYAEAILPDVVAFLLGLLGLIGLRGVRDWMHQHLRHWGGLFLLLVSLGGLGTLIWFRVQGVNERSSLRVTKARARAPV